MNKKEKNAISVLKSFIDFYNKKPKEDDRKFKMLQVDNIDINAIQTILNLVDKQEKERKKKHKNCINKKEFIKKANKLYEEAENGAWDYDYWNGMSAVLDLID